MSAAQMKIDNVDFQNTKGSSDSGIDRSMNPESLSVVIHERMEPIEHLWRALEADNLNSLHHGYDWCRAWVSAFNRPLRIVEGRLGDTLAFILPLEIARGRLFTKAQFIGADHANINTGLLSNAFRQSATPELMTAIADSLSKHIAGADCIVLRNMPITWRGHDLPFSMLPHIENQNHAFQLEIKPTFVETLAQLNAKRRRTKFSYGHRKLEALGGYEHIVAETADEKRKLLELFFAQKGARLTEFGLPNTFACAKTRAFFHNATQLHQEEDSFAIRLHALRMTGGEFAGQIPAITGLSRKGDHMVVQFCSIGNGPATEAAPGELLFHLAIERYNAEGIALFDFGIGDMPFKRAWCSQETVQVNVNVPVTPLGRLAAVKEETSTRLKTMIKQNPALYSFVQKIRTRVQGSPTQTAQEKAED